MLYIAGSAQIIFQSMLIDGATADEAYCNVRDLMKENDNVWKGVTRKAPAQLIMKGDSDATLAIYFAIKILHCYEQKKTFLLTRYLVFFCEVRMHLDFCEI